MTNTLNYNFVLWKLGQMIAEEELQKARYMTDLLSILHFPTLVKTKIMSHWTGQFLNLNPVTLKFHPKLTSKYLQLLTRGTNYESFLSLLNRSKSTGSGTQP